jgi:hypothetical protein
MSIDRGMFNYQDVMNKFYNYEPGEDDSEGRSIKNSFMANMVQSGYDANLAKDMAFTQSGIAKSNMNQAADLELRNKTALMNDEFNKGALNTGQQFEMQNRFAEDQNVRDITKDTTGSAVNFEFGNRAAENQNVRDMTKDSIQRADDYEYQNQFAENQAQRDITKSTYDQGANFDYQDKLEDNRNIRDMANKGFQGDEQRKTLAATGTQQRLDYVVQGEQQRYGTMQQGDETRRSDSNRSEEGRETMREADRIEAGAQNRRSARSRTMARSF